MTKLIRVLKNIYHLLSAIIAVIYYRYPAKGMTVIGITGTDGKTTTANLVYHLLASHGLKVGLVTTINAKIGSKIIETGFHVTSPDSWALQKLLLQMKLEGIKTVVLEVTSHGLDQHRFWGIPFTIGVVTNVTHDHLDYHQTYDEYLSVKATLLNKVKTSILNIDDDSYQTLRSKALGRVVSVGIRSRADLEAHNLSIENSQQNFILDNIEFITPLIGSYNVLNILEAIAVADELNLSRQESSKYLKSFPQLPGRFEIIDESQKYLVIVDFAHTPNALSNLLNLIHQLKTDGVKINHWQMNSQSKIILVFGCAGLRDLEKRPLMGAIAVRNAQYSIFTAEDPRSENLSNIIDSMAKGAIDTGGKEGISFIKEPDRKIAIKKALGIAQPHDIVIVAGKGHEKSMCFGTTEMSWSDQDIIREELGKLQK